MKYERRVIAELVMESVHDSYLEVGSLDGDLVRDVLEINPQAKVVSVDVAHTKVFHKRFGSDNRVEIVKARSDKAAKRLADRVFPNIYIDANHTYKWVKKDIETYWKLWDGMGFFGGHDFVKNKPKKYGVIQAVTEFFEIPNFRAVHRIWDVKDGKLFISGTNWVFVREWGLFEEYVESCL